MKILNPFRIGLLGGLGVLLAVALGAALAQTATILTYVFAAIFLALGLDPLISFLQRRHLPRWLAMVIVVIVVLGVVVGLIFAVVPVIAEQTSVLVTQVGKFATTGGGQAFLKQVQAAVPKSIDVNDVVDQITSFLQKNVATISTGVLSVGLGIVSGIAGAAIVIILTLYFAASLDTFKRGLYRLVPMTRRQKFADIAEQIFQAVGRYVIGQVSLALVNGILTFALLSILGGIGAALPAVFAFVAFIGSLIPLVGTVSAAVLITLGQLVLAPTATAGAPPVWLVVGIYYLIYMQVEAYVLNPTIMKRAVRVPGVLVVIAALTGGTLLGILGALVAIPVAAAVLLIVEQVVIPRQNEL